MVNTIFVIQFFKNKNVLIFTSAAYLKMYDSLSSYEQLLCKCASVLGQKFLRPMLSYVISNSTDRMIAIG